MIMNNLLALLVVIVIIIGTILFINKPKVKDIISLLFIIYIVFLAYVVTSPQIIYFESNFIPFKEILRYDFLSPLFLKNIIGNIILFIPLGFLIAYKLNLKHFYSVILLSLYFSVCIESLQLVIGRVFDIDDILLNTIGGICGFLIFQIFFKKLKK